MMCSASGRATPGLPSQLAINAARDIAFQREQTLGRIQQIQNFGAHVIHRREATPGRFTLTTFLCTLQRATSKTSPALRLHASYRHAATLDTGPLAKSYPRGNSPRVSSNHFQSARSPLCSLRLAQFGSTFLMKESLFVLTFTSVVSPQISVDWPLTFPVIESIDAFEALIEH